MDGSLHPYAPKFWSNVPNTVHTRSLIHLVTCRGRWVVDSCGKKMMDISPREGDSPSYMGPSENSNIEINDDLCGMNWNYSTVHTSMYAARYRSFKHDDQLPPVSIYPACRQAA